MTDLLLRRLAAPPPEGASVGTIPFPSGLIPRAVAPAAEIPGPLPAADVVVMTYTTAEAQAAADVLTAGVHRTSWSAYTHDWASYEPQLTGRSPAHEAKCMAHACVTHIGAKTVLVVKSELHLSTDASSMPVRQLVKQIIAETGCLLFITTGTAGGVGATEVLGDVVIADGVKFNLAKSQWEHEPYAQQRFPSTEQITYDQAQLLTEAFGKLVPAAIGDNLKPSGYAPRLPQIITDKDIETVGYFAFADTDDSYGVVKNDSNAGCEEMDDAAVALAISELDDPPAWFAVRNASDPQMGAGPLAEQKKQAELVYERYGYWTTVCSALACWAIIAGMT